LGYEFKKKKRLQTFLHRATSDMQKRNLFACVTKLGDRLQP